MKTALAYLFILCLSLGNWIALLVYGFGMTPQNWWVVFGCGIFGQSLLSMGLKKLQKEEEE